MTTFQNVPDNQATTCAGMIFAERHTILRTWLSLVGVNEAEPASAFIRDQLDASILALAEWFLDGDPEKTTMSMQWIGIRPEPELVAGAVLSMGLLPQAVQPILQHSQRVDATFANRRINAFSHEMITRILRETNLDFQESRWDEISREIEIRYEAQRVQRVRRLGVLIDISHAVSTGQDLDSLFDKVYTATARLSGCDYTEISLVDKRSGQLRPWVVAWQGERQTSLEHQALGPGLADDVLRDGVEFAVADYASECWRREIAPLPLLDDGQQRAWLGAPLHRGGEVIGVIAISCPLTSFDREDVELVAAVARQTAVALENHRLLEVQQRHVSQLSAVNRIAREIAELHDPSQLLSASAERIHDLFGYGLVTIFLADNQRNRMTMAARAPIAIDADSFAFAIDIEARSIVSDVARTRRAARYDDVRDAPNYVATPETAYTRSEMALPIVHSGTLIGILDVQSDMPAAFDHHDLTTLNTIADQIASGLENSRLFVDEAQRSRELQLIFDTTRAASSSLLLDEVLEHLADGIAEAAGVDRCLISLYNAEEQVFQPAVIVAPGDNDHDDQFGEWNQVLRLSECPDLQHLLDDAHPVVACSFPSPAEATETVASIVLPLRSRKRTLGFAVIPADIDADTPYPAEQMRLVQGVADSAALAIENARLYARAHGLAIAEERGRLAQEIHDTLAQGLTAISLQLDLADSHLPQNSEKAKKNVQRALELTRQNLDDARRSVLDLRAADVHRMSLPDALTRLLRRLGDETDMTWDFSSEGLTSRLSARIEVGLYRMAEEALANARSHSNAANVQVRLLADGETVHLMIDDDGRGFDPQELASQNGASSGFGLFGIRERARLLGGSVVISSRPGEGTSLRVTVPFEVRPAPAISPAGQQGEIK